MGHQQTEFHLPLSINLRQRDNAEFCLVTLSELISQETDRKELAAIALELASCSHNFRPPDDEEQVMTEVTNRLRSFHERTVD